MDGFSVGLVRGNEGMDFSEVDSEGKGELVVTAGGNREVEGGVGGE